MQVDVPVDDDPGGVAHDHHGCLWATLPGSISTLSFIPWSLRFAELTRGYRAMKPPASLPAQPATGISLSQIGSWEHGHGVFFISNRRIETCSWTLCMQPPGGWPRFSWKCKKTKAYGLASCRHAPDRVARNPDLQKGQGLRPSFPSPPA